MSNMGSQRPLISVSKSRYETWLIWSIGLVVTAGIIVINTGAPWVDGIDLFLQHARPLVDVPGFTWSYREVDPDVFGEKLETEHYNHAERIAAVVLTVTKTQS